jgi:hypothetical protein
MLNINARNPQNLSVTILTLNGKSLCSKIFDHHTAHLKMEIPVHELSSGTYLVKSEGSGASVTKLINVMH